MKEEEEGKGGEEKGSRWRGVRRGEKGDGRVRIKSGKPAGKGNKDEWEK